MTEPYILQDGQKNLQYINNFSHCKYIKIVSFIGFQKNYIEAFACMEEDDNEVTNMVMGICNTAIIDKIIKIPLV